jgi:hypothetical protein
MRVHQRRIVMRRLIGVIVLVLLFMARGRMILSNPAETEMECREIEATQTVTADLSTFTTRGGIRGDLRGTTQFTGDSTSLVPVSGTFSPPLNPTLVYTGDLVITTNKGTLTTRGVGVFENVPFGSGSQFDRVIAGTGRFRDATGILHFSFRANGDLSGFTSSVTGTLCLKEAADNDGFLPD